VSLVRSRPAGFLVTGVALLIAVVMYSCASTPEPPNAHDVFIHTLDEPHLAVAQAADYLRRIPLEIESDTLSAGIRTPSDIYRAAADAGACGDGPGSWTPSQLVTAIENHNVNNFRQVVDADVLGAFPDAETPLQMLNDQARMHSGIGDTPAGPVIGTQRLECQRLQCPTLQSPGCLFGTSKSSGEVPESFAVHDLDYIVVVRAGCCSRQSRVTADAPQLSHDVVAMRAEAEQALLAQELAAETYDSSDIYRLMFLLPVEYRGRADTELALPSALRDVVGDGFRATTSGILKSFKNPASASVTLTFDRKQVDRITVEYGEWFEALSKSGQVYVSPLLARVPFFVCYGHGVPRYLRQRANYLSYVQRHPGWVGIEADDARAVALAMKSLDTEYRSCVDAQLYFVFAHEMGHVVDPAQSSDPYLAEVGADCFAYVAAADRGKVDFGVFEQLFLNHPDSDPYLKGLMMTRITALKSLADIFATQPPALGTGEARVAYCRQFAVEHAKQG
jgi:hypothetical protein